MFPAFGGTPLDISAEKHYTLVGKRGIRGLRIACQRKPPPQQTMGDSTVIKTIDQALAQLAGIIDGVCTDLDNYALATDLDTIRRILRTDSISDTQFISVDNPETAFRY